MKTTKFNKIFGPILILVVVCVFFALNGEIKKADAQWQQKEWFIFTNDVENFNDNEQIEINEIKKYKSKDAFNDRIYYQKLSENEKLVYNAYQYALDKNYVYTYVDNNLLKDSEFDAVDLMEIFALDNAKVQQNLDYKNYTYEPEFTSRSYWKILTKSSEGVIVGVTNFSKDRMQKTEKAINQLKKIDFNFNEKTTEYEKVKKIYSYVQENMVYTDYEDGKMGTIDFLYEAVVKGEGNCDGYATMFSTLCTLNGIENFGKQFAPLIEETEEKNESTEQVIGHTWNAVNVDGKWYNADATEAKEDFENYEIFFISTKIFYADDLQADPQDYDELVPECKENSEFFAGYYKTFSDDGIVTAVSKAIESGEEEVAVFAIEKFKEGDETSTLRRVANRIWEDLSYRADERENYTVFCVYTQR